MTSDKIGKRFTGKEFLGVVISIIITLLLLYLAFKNINIKEVFVILLKRVSISYFLLFIAVFLLTNLIRALRWKYILQNVKKDISFYNLFGAMMIGYGVNEIIPRLGEFYRAFFLGKWEGVSRSSMFGTVIVERLVDLLSLFLSVVVSVLIYSGDIYSEIPWIKSTLLWGSLIIGLALVMLVLIAISGEKSYSVIVRLVQKVSEKAAKQLAGIFESLVAGLSSLNGAYNIFMVLLLSVFIMLLYGLNSLVGFYLLDMQALGAVNYKIAWILMTISAFGIVIPTPGGIGSYHAIVIFVLSMLFHFDKEISASYAIITHFISYSGFIILAFASIWYVNRKQIKMGKPKYNFWSVLRNKNED